MKPVPEGWPRISSSAFYDDPRAAIEWLCSVFGFELRLLVETGDGGVAHSELCYGEGVIMVAQAGGKRGISPKAAGGVTQTMMVYVDDVEAHYAKVRAAGAKITTELQTSDYGEEYWSDRSYGVTDIGGHSWWFCQRLATGKLDWNKVRDKRDRSHHEQA